MKIENAGKVKQAVVASLFGVSHSAVSRWPCPRNADGTYDLKAVIQWRVSKADEDAEVSGNSASRDPATARWRMAKAKRAEFELGLLEGRVVDKAEVETQWCRLLTRLRQGIMSIPDRIANAASVAEAVVLCRDIARGELNAVADEYDGGASGTGDRG